MPWLQIAIGLYVAMMASGFVYAGVRAIRNALRMRSDSAEHRGYLAGLDEGAAVHEKLERARRRWKRAAAPRTE